MSQTSEKASPTRQQNVESYIRSWDDIIWRLCRKILRFSQLEFCILSDLRSAVRFFGPYKDGVGGCWYLRWAKQSTFLWDVKRLQSVEVFQDHCFHHGFIINLFQKVICLIFFKTALCHCQLQPMWLCSQNQMISNRVHLMKRVLK